VPAEEVNGIFRQLEESVRQRLDEQGLDFTGVSIRREVDIRYSLQLGEVSTPAPNGTLTDEDVHEVCDRFEELYEQLFGKGTGFRDAGFQFITYRVFATGHLAFKPELPSVEVGDSRTPPQKATREARLSVDSGFEKTPVYDYAALRAGHQVMGPAIVEAPTTTVVVPRGHMGEVDALGNLAMRSERSTNAAAGSGI
jgi:N-methylhydantoinase A